MSNHSPVTSSPQTEARYAEPPPALGELRWTVRLLGAVHATAAAPNDGQTLTRWPSRAVACLLARLALEPERAHAREELVELLWPGVAIDVGRNRLRQALSTLKSLLEPANTPGHRVLEADRWVVRVVRGALTCDAREFERLVRSGRATQALAGYGGEFMPGYYEDWVQNERQRLSALHDEWSGSRFANPASLASPTPASLPPGTRQPGPLADAPMPSQAPLPSYLTRLFGADLAAARLHAAVRNHRLVSLLGPGGSGKTRLGVEVAQALRRLPPWPAAEDASDDDTLRSFTRVAFVSLVSCSDVGQMHDAMAHALRLPSAGAQAPEVLVAALAGAPVLLVLDNFEQLVESAAGALSTMLARLPQLHLLVTSRRALGLDGETTVSAEPLQLPPAQAALGLAASNPAVALFVDRARAVRSDFHLNAGNHADVVALVRALHGLPLAIELAASRTRSFPPSAMVRLLAAGRSEPADGSPHLLLLTRSGPRSGLDPRHASMAEVIAWSWRLLDPAAQQTLTALTLFTGDAGLAAVAGALGEAPAQVAARLDELVAHSLLRVATPAGGEPRFGLLEPVREFVLSQAPEVNVKVLRAQLRRWFAAWAAAQAGRHALAQIGQELPTLQALLANAAADGAALDGLALMLALRSYLETDGLPGRVQTALAQALHAAADAPAMLRSDAHELLAYLRFAAGFRHEAQDHAQAALTAAADDPSRRARALVRRAWVAIAGALRADDPASELHARLQDDLQQALALARSCDDREAQARALQQLAQLAQHVDGQPQAAEALFEAAQNLWVALGDRHRAHARLRNRAQCWVLLGRHEEAHAAYAYCENAARDDGDWVGQFDTAASLGQLLALQRQWPAALQANQRALALCWQRWHRHGLAFTLWNLPRLLARLRRPEAAMPLLGFATTFWTTNFGPLTATDSRHIRRVRGLVQAQLGVARTQALWQAGTTMDLAGAMALAMQA